ncbi:hypothetical protein Trydic_g17546 [Trypoxylus dichotomus]
MESGVLQGFALDPVLFAIYIRDIPKTLDRRVCNPVYADYTAIVAISRHPKIAAGLAQPYLAKNRVLLHLEFQDQSKENASDCIH